MGADDATEPDARRVRGTKVSRQQLEEKFKKTLTGATLVGHFTLTGKKPGDLKEERYTIKALNKINEEKDLWLFTARVKYGTRDVTVPMPLFVKWAGDTPVISLTNVKIPKLGTYTARVVIYGDQYAGTWSGDGYGGHLFGKIEPAQPAKSR